MSCVVSRVSVSWCVQQPTGATAMSCPSESSHTQAFEGSTFRFKGELTTQNMMGTGMETEWGSRVS